MRPCGTSRSPFPREMLREPDFSAGIPRVDAWSFYHVIFAAPDRARRRGGGLGAGGRDAAGLSLSLCAAGFALSAFSPHR